MSHRVIGQSINRVGGHERVAGTYRYVGDIKVPGMLHAKLVHLDCGRARIKSIDASEALAMEGVHAVLTGADLPNPVPRFGPAQKDRPLLAVDETAFHGEPVAIVAAENAFIAGRAAAAVRVDYKELPGIYTIGDALSPDAHLVRSPDLRPPGPFVNSNVLNEWRHEWGDVDSASAETVFEHDYTFPIVTQFAIEPLAYIAEPTSHGLTLYTPIQHPNFMQKVMAELLDLPLSRVRVIAPDPGGAFGGKQHAKHEPVLAWLAMKIGKPIRLELTLEETFQAVRRAAAEAHVRTGINADGTMVFRDIEINYLIGAYEDIAGRVVNKASYVGAGPYRTPNVRIVARAVMSNTLPSTAYRGFGIPQVNWASEMQMDEMAHALGIDPVELRVRNLPDRGEVFMPGDPAADGKWVETLRAAAEEIKWGSPVPEGRGRGIALGLKSGPTTGSSYSIVRFHMDGSATVLANTSDMGQGARTVFTQIAAEELGLPPDRIALVMGDTAGAPFDLQTSASRSTVFMGTAIQRACQDIASQMVEMARDWYGASVELGDPGTLIVDGKPQGFTDFVGERFRRVKGEVIGTGSSRSEYDPDHALGGLPAFYDLSCSAVELSVDQETGETIIHKIVSVADVGTALNPQHVAMQDDGAAIQALGHSIMEHYVLDENGRVRNLGALDYRIPTTKDVPIEMVSHHIENGDGPGPYGAKGAGEGGILALASALGSAVANATGVHIRDLPLTPERIWEALQSDRDEGEKGATTQ